MRSVNRVTSAVLTLGLVGGLAAAPPASAPGDLTGNASIDPALEATVADLAARSARTRAAAEERIRALDAAARPALLRAARGPDAGLAAVARDWLLRISWFEPGDPPQFRLALTRYGQLEEPAARELITNLTEAGATGALFRIVDQDPRAALAWAASDALQVLILRNDAAARAAAALTAREAPALVLRGKAVYRDDRRGAIAALEAALEQERQFLTATPDQLDWPFEFLSGDARQREDYPALVRLYRLRAQLAPGDGRPRADLFAVHARFGPREGFADDLLAYAAGPAEPRVLYALAALCDNLHATLYARLLREQAYAVIDNAGAAAHYTHYLTGDFLSAYRWYDDADRELNAAVTAAVPGNDQFVVNALFRLSDLALRRENYDAAADLLEQALSRTDGGLRHRNSDGEWEEWRPEDAKAQALWHRLVGARKKKDAVAIARNVEAIAALQPKETWLFLDVQPDLVAAGKEELLKSYFDTVYAFHAARLMEAPGDSRRLNDLAWIGARSGYKPEEALRYARQAVAKAPDDPSYLDTLGEALFRNHLLAEALEVERKALALKPGDTFMTEQVAKFEKALKDGPTTRGTH